VASTCKVKYGLRLIILKLESRWEGDMERESVCAFDLKKNKVKRKGNRILFM
jgi:hypothetical protein